MYQPTQRMVVSAVNANGEADFYFVTLLNVPEEDYDLGNHYDRAMELAEDEGYEPKLAYDDCEITTTGLCKLFVWESSSRIEYKGV